MTSIQSNPPANSRRSPAIKLLAGVLALVAIIGIAWVLNSRSDVLTNTLEWIEERRALGALVFFGIYVVATVAFLPGSVLTLGAGAVYGIGWGTLLVSVSSIAGASAAFLVGRYFARDWIAKRIDQRPKFKAVDDAVAREGWKIVALTRLSPVFPFNFLNYAFGLTQVGFWPYFFASWIAMLPGTLMYVYIGSAIGNIATLGERERTPMEWAFFALGLVVTVVITVYITRIARRALAARVRP